MTEIALPLLTRDNKLIQFIADAELDQWIAWERVQRDGRIDKVPCSWTRFASDSISSFVSHPINAMDPKNWLDFITVRKKLIYADSEEYGMGFVLRCGTGLTVIDVDYPKQHPDETDEAFAGRVSSFEKICADLLSEFRDTYVERSVGGKGIHLWVLGQVQASVKTTVNGVTVEMYSDARFFTVSGNFLPSRNVQPKEHQLELSRLYDQLSASRPKPIHAVIPPRAGRELSKKEGDKYARLFAGQWSGEYPTQSEADFALCTLLAKKHGTDAAKIDAEFRNSGLYRKWKWEQRLDYRERTVKTAIEAAFISRAEEPAPRETVTVSKPDDPMPEMPEQEAWLSELENADGDDGSSADGPTTICQDGAKKQAQIPQTGKEQSNGDAVPQTGKSNVPRKRQFIFTPEEVATMDIKPREYIVDGLLPKVGTSLIAATPKTGKGTLTRQLCVSVANGEPFLGRATVKGRTLFCSRQEMLSDIVEKLKQANGGEMPNVLISPVDLPLPGDAEAKIRAVLQEATECGEPVSLVVLDMLSSFFKMKDGHYDEAFAALEPLQELAVEFNTHICVVHHGNKATTPANLSLNSVMGSAAISGSVDTILGMCADPETDRRCIASWQRTGKQVSKHWLDWNENTLRVSLGKAYGHVDDPLRKRRETSERVAEFVKDNPGCSLHKIHEAVGGRYGEMQKIVEDLTTEGKHIRKEERSGKGGGKAYFPANPLYPPYDLREQTSSHLPV